MKICIQKGNKGRTWYWRIRNTETPLPEWLTEWVPAETEEGARRCAETAAREFMQEPVSYEYDYPAVADQSDTGRRQ